MYVEKKSLHFLSFAVCTHPTQPQVAVNHTFPEEQEDWLVAEMSVNVQSFRWVGVSTQGHHAVRESFHTRERRQKEKKELF